MEGCLLEKSDFEKWENMKMTDEERKSQLKRHQEILTEMLQEIDGICKKYEISYLLFAGTALGAVRHQGFIPWDDDLDIVMMRSDYERFLKIASQELDSEMYYVQKEFSEHFPNFFSKLRKNNTACIERYVPKDPKVHQGIYVDIFPCDNLSDHFLKRRLQFLASKMVIASSLEERGYFTDNPFKKCAMMLCKYVPRKKLLEYTQNRKEYNSKNVHTFFGAASKYEKNVFPREWFIQKTELNFEGKKYPVSSSYDQMLKKIYGDYMIPTPESERGKKVHAVIIDFENSYENYIEIQKKMDIEEYTRSIR